jgi:hypothetical protein
MRRIPIGEAEPGQTLAKPVTNGNGLPVLSEGAVLSDALIARLRRMGLAAIYVEGQALQEGESVKTLPELERELTQRFRKVAGDPLQDRIRAAIIRHLRAMYGAPTGERREAP